MWIEPPTEGDAADDRTKIKKTRGHRRRAEDVFRIEHSHHQRGERDEQDERPHDAGEQNRGLRFFGRPTPPRHQVNELRRVNDSDQRDCAHENSRQGCDFVAEPPRRFIASGRDLSREGGDERSRESAFSEQIAQ